MHWENEEDDGPGCGRRGRLLYGMNVKWRWDSAGWGWWRVEVIVKG